MSIRTSSAQICGDASSRRAAWGNVIWSPDGSRTRCRPTGELAVRSTGTVTLSSCYLTHISGSCGAVMQITQVLPYHASYAPKDRTALRLPAPRADRARLDPPARLAPDHGDRLGQCPVAAGALRQEHQGAPGAHGRPAH